MVELLEKVVNEENEKNLRLSEAGIIGMRDGKEHIISKDYSNHINSREYTVGVRIYSCDADCDNCHCATF